MSNDPPMILAPASIPQEQFLESTSTITLYAGSAGAGKSFALILNMVKFAAMRNSTIVCFRRTSPELRAPGGIWQEARTVFRKMFLDCKIKDKEMEITIPSTNSVVKFGSLQYQSDVDKALGAQYSAIFLDEAVTFEPFEQFVLPLIGRLRNVNVSYTPQMFWATNPRFNHGIYNWIKDFYLDDQGIPLKEKSNVERYFVLQNNNPIWFDDIVSAREYCSKIPAPPGQEIKPRSFRAIRAHVTDNVPLMTNNPDYIANLQAMTEVRRRIYLDGSWTAREEESGYFKREFVKIVPFPNMLANRRVRAWDLSSTKPSTANPDPDWTRGTLVSKDKNSLYTVEDIQSLRDRPHEVEMLIYRTALEDPQGTIVVLPVDPGQAGIAYASTIKVRLAEIGVTCKLVRVNKSKLTRFLPFSAIAEAGHVQFVKSEWLEEAFTELENFNGTRNNGHDDICDTLSDAILVLNQGPGELPSMQIPDLSSSSQPSLSFNFNALSSGNSTPFSLPTFNVT